MRSPITPYGRGRHLARNEAVELETEMPLGRGLDWQERGLPYSPCGRARRPVPTSTRYPKLDVDRLLRHLRYLQTVRHHRLRRAQLPDELLVADAERVEERTEVVVLDPE
ncbi:MAG: hypothetical protein M0Z42_10500 [Actinomycetota bacterium]|jgi:hypothetical protein|nr:hypothetical protein [Actinomycetota bacterium]